MPREKKKSIQLVEVRPDAAALAADFSGLIEASPLPVSSEPEKAGAATSGVIPSTPTPVVTPKPPAKPRQRKTPTVTRKSPAPLEVVAEPAPASLPQASEIKNLLEAIVQQCREAQTQLQHEREERVIVDQELESARQQSQSAHEQLRHNAAEAHQLHEQLSHRVKEAKTAHEQLVQGFEKDISRLHQNINVAGQAMQDLPRQAEAIRIHLAKVQD